MMAAAFFLGLAAVVVGVYWLIGRDIDRAGKHKDPEDATSGVPSVSAAPPIPSPVALGATLEVTSQDGKKAAYTVSNLLPAAASQFTQVKGTLYSIDVTVQGIAGSVPVSPLYFSASTQDGTHLDADLTAVDNQLAVSDLPQGQHVSGRVAFDVPTGKNITQILLSGPLASEQALWSV